MCKIYFVTKRNTSNIVKVFDGTGVYIASNSYLIDAYKYCFEISKASLSLNSEVEELEVISRDEFIEKYGEEEIGYAEE